MRPVVILSILFFSVQAISQNLTVNIEGNVSFNPSGLTINEAGEDFTAVLESESPLYLTVAFDDNYNKKINPNTKWNVKVYKSDVNWNPDLKLEARRTGEGTRLDHRGNPHLEDGGSYQELSNNSTYFFRGKGEMGYIPVSLRVNGFSLTMGAQTFETNIIFTVYDDW